MARHNPSTLARATNDPYAYPRKLAQKMVRVVNTENATDASIAVAMLIAGVVAVQAEGADEAKSLMLGIRAFGALYRRVVAR